MTEDLFPDGDPARCDILDRRVASGNNHDLFPDDDHPSTEDQTSGVSSGNNSGLGPRQMLKPKAHPSESYLELMYASDLLNDLERLRIATGNRVHSMVHPTVEGEKGGWFGKALDPNDPEVVWLRSIADRLHELEKEAESRLKKKMRRHPLGPWVKTTHGIGEKTVARLLGVIGDPASRKTVSQLWAYCGLKPGQRKAKGEKAGFNVKAKTRAWLCIEKICTHPGSPYEKEYRKRHAHTLETHPDWTKLHRQRDAQRVAMKALLRDLWIEARKTSGRA